LNPNLDSSPNSDISLCNGFCLLLIVTTKNTLMAPLTTEEKGRIVGMRNAGLKGSEIARKLGHPASTVYTVLANYDKRGTVEPRKSSGRPPKLSDRDRRHLNQLVNKNRKAPLAEITNMLDANVSARTVVRAVHELGYRARVAAIKPFLNPSHIAKRLEFALSHQHWTVEEWKRVIWTDESSFQIGQNSRRTIVWRRKSEKYNSNCLAPSFKSGRTSIMVWGAFVGHTRLPLVFMPPNERDAASFVKNVYDIALGPFLNNQKNATSLVLMEDGAPVHKSKIANAWKESKSLTWLNWPANSPDLNPIENVWHMIKDVVQQNRRPKSKKEMELAVEAEWNAISDEKLMSLVATMPARIDAVIQAKGGSTRW